MDRRRFAGLCGALLGPLPLGASALEALGEGPADGASDASASAPPAPRTALAFEDGSPVRPDDLAPDEAYLFGYPYRVTPAFLVRLADGRTVAFSAICSHKMTAPSRPISHIAYRVEPVSFVDRAGERHERAGVISCCSERSVYDPAADGAVLAGPARAALARIELELDGEGIVAVGSVGADRYEPFLERFGFRLAMEHGTSDVRRRAGDVATVEPAARYSAQTIRC